MKDEEYMLVVGLTGVIGSGKSKVSKMFAKLGAHIIDCDVIAHNLTMDRNSILLSQLVELFGAQILTKQHQLDRNKLRQIVFSEPDLRKKLEQLIHPLIYQEVVKQLQSATKVKYCLLVVPLLFKFPEYLQLINRSIVVSCDYQLLIARLRQRSNLSLSDVDVILATQMPQDKQLALADDIIENNHDETSLFTQVNQLHHDYLARYCNVQKKQI